ncbi:DUF4402 domain-containing protein [Gillisia sp. CAL575]|uniref:DUF4402 domain-containing protein n=1 Tax=Gillisia sp. CAL575 TaxID=985255 RepID=UPI0005534F3C|nr:DUF4402 domain-containing protein [Gillisia sp. CAL575]
MKNINALILILLLCFSSMSFAQATATFNASVTIIQPIGITTTSDLKFANIDAKNGGEVTLSPNSTRSTAGEVLLSDGGTVSAASFEITGEPGYTYGITLPGDNHVLSNGTETMVINNFTTDFNGDNALASGPQTINVGATLKVNPNQTPGNYINQGGFNVTVNYN